MTVLLWDQSGDRLYETGVDKAVLYIPTAGVTRKICFHFDCFLSKRLTS